MAANPKLRIVLNFTSAIKLEFGRNLTTVASMKILTDDPDWRRDVYEVRALAMTLIRKRGRAVEGSGCLEAARNGLTVRYDANHSPVQLTIDTTEARVLSVEWKEGDAWRMAIETYRSGRWKSRLKTAVQPRPWLERCRALLTFTGTLPPVGRPRQTGLPFAAFPTDTGLAAIAGNTEGRIPVF